MLGLSWASMGWPRTLWRTITRAFVGGQLGQPLCCFLYSLQEGLTSQPFGRPSFSDWTPGASRRRRRRRDHVTSSRVYATRRGWQWRRWSLIGVGHRDVFHVLITEEVVSRTPCGSCRGIRARFLRGRGAGRALRTPGTGVGLSALRVPWIAIVPGSVLRGRLLARTLPKTFFGHDVVPRAPYGIRDNYLKWSLYSSVIVKAETSTNRSFLSFS